MKNKIIVMLIALMNVLSLYSQDWQIDLAQAKAIAAEEDKAIILVFQGSDWCAPCMKLDREIWSTDAFKTYAAAHYVMLQADFPRRKQNALPEAQAESNAVLAETYNTRGIFPLVVVLDSTGKVLGETGYKKTTPEDYIQELNQLIP